MIIEEIIIELERAWNAGDGDAWSVNLVAEQARGPAGTRQRETPYHTIAPTPDESGASG